MLHSAHFAEKLQHVSIMDLALTILLPLSLR